MISSKEKESRKSPHTGFLRGTKQRAYDAIDKFGEMEPLQIANIIGTSAANANNILNELRKQGILDRRKNGRAYIYFISKKGSVK